MGFIDWLRGRQRPPAAAPPPLTSKARVERAARPPARRGSPPISQRSTIYSSEFLAANQVAKSLANGPDGMPTGRLRRVRDLWVIVPDDGAGMINPTGPGLVRLGIIGFRVRGVSYNADAVKDGNFRRGAKVRVVRERDNEHDPNAVAVYAAGALRPAGYVNKQKAKPLARRLDAGERLEAISVRGDGPNVDGAAPWILVAAAEVIAHLRRKGP